MSATCCRTCNGYLSDRDLKDGSKRCKDCRIASPGRQWLTQKPPQASVNWRSFEANPQRHAVKRPSESWWVEKDQASFYAEVRVREAARLQRRTVYLESTLTP